MFYYSDARLQEYREASRSKQFELYEKYPFLREIFNSIDLEKFAAQSPTSSEDLQ